MNSEVDTEADNGPEPIFNMCVCVAIDTMLKLTLTFTQTHTQTLSVNKLLSEAYHKTTADTKQTGLSFSELIGHSIVQSRKSQQ